MQARIYIKTRANPSIAAAPGGPSRSAAVHAAPDTTNAATGTPEVAMKTGYVGRQPDMGLEFRSAGMLSGSVRRVLLPALACRSQ